jgi:hypothetical protein
VSRDFLGVAGAHAPGRRLRAEHTRPRLAVDRACLPVMAGRTARDLGRMSCRPSAGASRTTRRRRPRRSPGTCHPRSGAVARGRPGTAVRRPGGAAGAPVAGGLAGWACQHVDTGHSALLRRRPSGGVSNRHRAFRRSWVAAPVAGCGPRLRGRSRPSRHPVEDRARDPAFRRCPMASARGMKRGARRHPPVIRSRCHKRSGSAVIGRSGRCSRRAGWPTRTDRRGNSDAMPPLQHHESVSHGPGVALARRALVGNRHVGCHGDGCVSKHAGGDVT